MRKVEASAPSNIALIKYMGKSKADQNLPANSSISYTLENLRTFVVVEETSGADRWEPLPHFQKIELSEGGQQKFLKHFDRLKQYWGIEGHYLIRSANNFPSDCGLASSASSFAALTLAGWELANRPEISREELSGLSRQGSGSSCRSFFTPWSAWSGAEAGPVDLDLKLEHAVVVVEAGKKLVSSSQAHARIPTSLLYEGRPERAERRFIELMQSLKSGDWRKSFELCWSEFWDMHALFETSEPAFGYMTEGSMRALQHFRSIWLKQGDGPLVTMDAGANIHLLLRPDQISKAGQWLKGYHSIKSWAE